MSSYEDSDNDIEETQEDVDIDIKDDNDDIEDDDNINEEEADFDEDGDFDDDDEPDDDDIDEGIDLVNNEGKTEIKDVSETIYEYYSKPKMTRNKLTKYERCRILAKRVQQLSVGAPPMVSKSDCRSMREIAEKELRMRRIPLIIRRKLPNDTYEDWKLSDLLI